MIDTIMIKFTQFEINRINNLSLNSARKYENFFKLGFNHFFLIFIFLLKNSRVCFPSKKEIELNFLK